MTAAGTCVITFAGNAIAIAWTGRSSHALLNALYPHNLTSRGLCSTNDYHYRLCAESDGHFRLYKANRLLYQGPSDGTAAGILTDCTVRDFADACRIGPLFHAAAISWHGRGILMPGKTGAGKTTLAAWLATRGWDYLTDEIACVDPISYNVHGLCRSPHLKVPIAPRLEQFARLEPIGPTSSTGKNVYHSERGLIVPVERIHLANTYSTPEVQLIIFPRFDRKAGVEFVRLSPAQSCARLVGAAVNIRNLPDHGFGDISRLARRTPSFSLVCGRLSQLEKRITALLEENVVQP